MAWAAFASVNLHLGLDNIDGGEYITLMTLIFGIYAGANVWGKKE